MADSSDCDDGDANQHPGADEYCNGEDDDCDGDTDEDDAVDVGTWYADSDGDSYGDASSIDIDCYEPTGFVADNNDCDDDDATQYPGADEYCNGEDDDCDGDTDEDDAVDVGTWYADSDGDSYGDASSIDIDCYEPTGFVADNNDCDDDDATQYPGADEYCNGEDDDCDGFTDEDDAVDVSTWYTDADGDSFGDATTTDIGCIQPSGFVADSTDCDDADSSVFPGAPETCEDGIDQNCDSTDPLCRFEGVIDLSDSSILRVSGENAYDQSGNGAAVGDINLDGHPDLLIGAKNNDESAMPTSSSMAFPKKMTQDSRWRALVTSTGMEFPTS